MRRFHRDVAPIATTTTIPSHLPSTTLAAGSTTTSSDIEYYVDSSSMPASKWSLEEYDGDAIEKHYNKNWGEVAERLINIGPPMLGTS